MNDLELEPDCSRCAALCCFAFAFDRVQGFPIDKPNGVPCPNLTTDNRCAVHKERAQLGYAACESYDCAGAGQRTTEELFSGRTWREEPELLPRIVSAFVTLSRVHELLALLKQAERLPLSTTERTDVNALVGILAPENGWSETSLAAFQIEAARSKTRSLLKTLRRHWPTSEAPQTSQNAE